MSAMEPADPCKACELEPLVADSGAGASFSTARRLGVIVGVLGMTGAIVSVASSGARSRFMPGGVAMQKEERVEITPSFPACSKAGENCLQSGCCQVSGHTCFQKTEHLSSCNLTCSTEKGWMCGRPHVHSVPVNRKLNDTLYCFSVYTKNTGTTKPSTELDLLKAQHKHHVSIFACEGWDVFSDVRVEIGGGYYTHMVEDHFQEFHRLKRKETGAWVNWAMFYQVWVKIRSLGRWEDKSWTVKVDPDAVFLPDRLQGWLENKRGEPPHGLYFENCKGVQYGFFGNLEVISYEATRVLTKYLEDCHAVYAPCADDGCDWQWGPWGEDVFLQRCMDRHFVDKVDAFDLTLDGACEADRPEGQKKNKKWHAEDCSQVATAAVHPFKKPKDYFSCLSQITHATYYD